MPRTALTTSIDARSVLTRYSGDGAPNAKTPIANVRPVPTRRSTAGTRNWTTTVTPSITVVTRPAAEGDAPPRPAHHGSDAGVAGKPVTPSRVRTTSLRRPGSRHNEDPAPAGS